MSGTTSFSGAQTSYIDKSLVLSTPPDSESEDTYATRSKSQPTRRIPDPTPTGSYWSHQQSNSEKPAGPQPESSATINLHLGDDNDGCGIMQNSFNTTITYSGEKISEIERVMGSGPQFKSQPTIVASAGKRNKNSIQFRDVGATRIIINDGTKVEDAHQRQKRKGPDSS
ncbi:unnamed protein product [Tuber melanosporum]|jgi:hypothetical protein|uniref:(Perigord truffle) hypothetical protein n=1 Tax=Tuber melanosporum (strain Mel28) TaxID=656061 RepID=D5GID7_TUBMM|nr:uncharacterized protein GSTUM_00008438001 [Tuber melanosporum]CAZ84280.1 unnamed protein product [Tuber melanosporum]